GEGARRRGPIPASKRGGLVGGVAGRAVRELRGRGWERGGGGRGLMRPPPFAGRRPVFVGDDVTDASVFAVLPEFGGVGFSVGRMFAGTAHCFSVPHDVRNWLAQISRLEAVATS